MQENSFIFSSSLRFSFLELAIAVFTICSQPAKKADVKTKSSNKMVINKIIFCPIKSFGIIRVKNIKYITKLKVKIGLSTIIEILFLIALYIYCSLLKFMFYYIDIIVKRQKKQGRKC